ncbi:hypothetical protein ABRP60_13510 [Pectobacterium brasiliense]|uniref:hypothetical protein n=1 Tax=Pectobacterium brasiliense TaxID=180957 RepID=UPI001F2E8FE7|nr:hypothetical protein [Pectobacterium brasiliense]
MVRYIEVKSIREGVYLLWRMGHSEEARRFSFGTQKNVQLINEKINKIIDAEVRESNGATRITKHVLRYSTIYSDHSVDESQLVWLKQDQYGCIYFWLRLIKEYVSFYPRDADDIHPKYYFRRKRHLWLIGEHLPSAIPDTPEQCYLATLSILDILLTLTSKNDSITSEIKNDYLNNKKMFRKDFSWMVDAGKENIEWVMEQFFSERRIFRDFRDVNIIPEMQGFAIPAIYYLWNEESAEKQLFLNTLRKRYANMKHRKKVATKAPVNIRISDSSKKTLVKLEKYLNRNRADVIEFLIDKAWADMNQKK